MNLTSDITALRRLSPDDLQAFQAYRNDPVIAQYQSWEQMDDVRARNFLVHASRANPLLQQGHWIQLAVAEAETDTLIGDVGVFLSKDGSEAEIGVTIAPGHQRKGHASRAIQLATQLVFDLTEASVVKAWADAKNTASRMMLQKAGFTFTSMETNDGIYEAAFEQLRST